MTAVNPFAFLFYQLDDMVSVFCLHDATHALGVVQVKRHVSELRHQLTSTYKTQFTTAFRTLRVLRIQPR